MIPPTRIVSGPLMVLINALSAAIVNARFRGVRYTCIDQVEIADERARQVASEYPDVAAHVFQVADEATWNMQVSEDGGIRLGELEMPGAPGYENENNLTWCIFIVTLDVTNKLGPVYPALIERT